LKTSEISKQQIIILMQEKVDFRVNLFYECVFYFSFSNKDWVFYFMHACFSFSFQIRIAFSFSIRIMYFFFQLGFLFFFLVKLEVT
jgi:hypothetical protein